MNKKRKNQFKETILIHIKKSKKEYIIISLMFLIGIFIGVFFVNNIDENQKGEVLNFFSSSIEQLKKIENFNYMENLKSSVTQNTIITVLLWFTGTTIIGIPFVFGIIAYKGFCLGYTIAISATSLGIGKGMAFVLSSLFIHNIIYIPAIIALGVSGLKLYKSIIKDKRKENIKTELLRHTVFSLLMLLLLVISSVIEIFVSTNILLLIVKYL